MPSALTYPGVYVEEIPSGVRTITGVATSITAFLGRAERGPVDKATTILNFSDFERMFGGLSKDYPVAFAVRDFFMNGGAQAIMVRLFSPRPAVDAQFASVEDQGMVLKAASPGAWGGKLAYGCDQEGITDEIAARIGLAKADLFNLRIFEKIEGQTNPVLRESFLNLSVKESVRRADRVLKAGSSLVQCTVDIAKPVPNKPAPTDFTKKGEDSKALVAADFQGAPKDKTGLYALDDADLVNLLCIPPDKLVPDADITASDDYNVPPTVLSTAAAYCTARRAMLIVDAPIAWQTAKGFQDLKGDPRGEKNKLQIDGTNGRNAALFFPRIIQNDPSRDGKPYAFPPCGIVAGIFAKTDATRGVWKAPAGQDAGLVGIKSLAVNLTDGENGLLNPVGINCLRYFQAGGNVVWGSRTLRGDDQLADEYKYIPIRRLALFIEESLYRGTQWAVFEPNDEPLWAQLRLNIGAFMQDLFRQGAFQGKTPREAYFVKCDKETTTQSDINRGIVNVVIGFAPLKPAEFVVLKLQQIAGQLDV